ncbi:MAG: biotin/lipoyl-containing protein [Promethearchaeota archaeon]
MPRKYELRINNTTITVEVDGPNNGIFNVTVGEATFPVTVTDGDRSAGTFKVTVGDKTHTIFVTPNPDTSDFTLKINQQVYAAELKSLARPPAFSFQVFPSKPITAPPQKPTTVVPEAAEPGTVTAPLPGRILDVRVKENQKIKIGEVLLVLEAMKMANEIRAPQGGIVRTLHVQAGDTVEKGQPMVSLQ